MPPVQYRHYEACLALFQLQPGQASSEFAEFVTFIAQARPTTRIQTAAWRQHGDGACAAATKTKRLAWLAGLTPAAAAQPCHLAPLHHN